MYMIAVLSDASIDVNNPYRYLIKASSILSVFLRNFSPVLQLLETHFFEKM